MKVKLAKTAGFCMGVRRAMEIVLAEANKKEGPLFTFGPLIHNNQVIDLLASKGVRPVEDLEGLRTGRIVIRAHGIPPQKHQAIKETGLKILDATCPRVTRVQSIVRSYTRKGYAAVIVGDEDHPEVIGLTGYANDRVHIIKSPKDVPALPRLDPAFVVAQTTQDEQNFQKIVQALRDRFPEIVVFNTICDATHQRQQEVREFADQVDALVVVGGYHSGNTRRLAEISREMGLPTFHIETEKDLDTKKLSGMETIGITAGASTPNWMINNVIRVIEGIRGKTESSIRRWIKQTSKLLVLSNFIIASSAFCFAYAASVLAETDPGFTFPVLTFLYIYAMHVLNRFLDKGASVYNDPERAAFLTKHRRLLIVTGIVAISAALALSYNIGLTTFFALSGLSLLGIIYSVPLVPKKIRHRLPYSKIKDIPGSRSLSESLAWVVVITLLPLLEIDQIIWPPVMVSALTVFLMSYTTSGLFDTFQVQGDLIVGTETLPVTLGEGRTLALLKIILLANALILIAGAAFGAAGPFSYVMLVPVLCLLLCIVAYEKHWLYPGIMLEALVEGNFFLAGLLALAWHAI